MNVILATVAAAGIDSGQDAGTVVSAAMGVLPLAASAGICPVSR